MSLQEITGLRDLTYSHWHRTEVREDCSWVDIDSCHYCKYCLSILCFFELVRSPDEYSLEEVCRRKVASMTERVGIRVGVPSFKIAYTGTPLSGAAVMKLGQHDIWRRTPAQLAQFIDELHNCAFCRERRNGRWSAARQRERQHRL